MGSALPRPEGMLEMAYVPRKQFVPFHKRKQRHSVLVTHRRCGKTVASIRNPQNGRVRESQWRGDMVRLRDAIIYCQACAAENFYDIQMMSAAGSPRCWRCGNDVQVPPRIRIGKDILVALNHDTKLFPHHIDGARMYNFSQPVAAVGRHPNDPTIWGLKNLSGDRWVCTAVGGADKDVAPGRSVTLAPGMKIGRSQGEVRR